jgi:pullulanase
LSIPLALLTQNRLDGLWNEWFKQIARQVILGRSWDREPSFEWSVRKLIDCRLLGFQDCTQAINYLTPHDIGGFGNERLYNWLQNNGIVETEQRIKLAFACLLTAVGTPMILAGDEFADQMDLDPNQPGRGDTNKQVDPVHFGRMDDEWRQRIFTHVARLVRLRTTAGALAVDDTTFIHCDLDSGKRVLAWQRGQGDDPVVVIANFSDYCTSDPTNPASEYRVKNWPATPPGKSWHEVTQDRAVPTEWAGREPIYPWEAKVYVLR